MRRCLILLVLWVVGCSSPMSLGELEVGQGAEVPQEGAVQAQIQVWLDPCGKRPFGRGRWKAIVPLQGGRFPGIAREIKGMKVGGKRRFRSDPKKFFESSLLSSLESRQPSKVYCEVELLKVFSYRPPEVELWKAGSGSEPLSGGERVRCNFKLWSGGFEGTALFPEAPPSVEVTLGDELWSTYLEGMRLGEIRRIQLSRGLACRVGGYPFAGDVCGLCVSGEDSDVYLQVELVEVLSYEEGGVFHAG